MGTQSEPYEAKTDFSNIYNQADPRAYFHTLGALSYEIVAVLEQQPDLHRLLVQVRDREPLDTVLHDRSGDRERVDLG